MKISLRKFIGSMFVPAIVAGCLAVGTVSSVYAADYTNGGVSVNPEKTVKTWTFTENMPSGSNTTLKNSDTVNGIIFKNIGEGCNLNKGNYLSAKTGAIFDIPVPVNCSGNIYVQATSGNAGRNVSFQDGAETKTMIMNTGSTNNSADFTSAATSTGFIQLTAAGGECKIGKIEVTLTDDSQFSDKVVEYTWSIDKSDLNIDLAGNLTLAEEKTTNLLNTLEYDGTDYRLLNEHKSVTGTPDDSNAVIVKPQDDWFEAVAPKTYVNVEPKVTGNKTVFDFTSAGKAYLVSTKSGNKTETSAYTDFSKDAGSDVDCWVELNGDKGNGAYLYDNSGASATKLVVPYSASEGKVTVSGTVQPTNNIGGKWALVNLGVVYLASNNEKNVVISNVNSGSEAENAGQLTTSPVEYSITVDFDTKTASGTVTNGSTQKEFKDVPFIDGTSSISNIVFVTNDGNSVDAGNDRGLLVPSVTIETGDAGETSTIASTVTKMGNNDYYALDVAGKYVYVIHPVKKSDQNYETADKLVLYPSGAQGQNDKLQDTSVIYEEIQFAEGDVLKLADLGDSEVVGMYAVRQAVDTPKAPTGTNYYFQLESAN